MDELVVGDRGEKKGETICLLFVYVSLAPLLSLRGRTRSCVCLRVCLFGWGKREIGKMMWMVTGDLLIDRGSGLYTYQLPTTKDDDDPPLFAL
jgi:hypothetical protein